MTLRLDILTILISLNALTLCPPDSYSAPGSYKIYTPEELTKAIRETVKRDSGIAVEEIATVQVPRLSPIRSPKEGNLAITVEGEARGGRLPIELNLKVGDRTIRRQRVFVLLDVFETAWILKRDLRAGEQIKKGDLKKDKVASKMLSRGTIKDLQVAIGSKLKRTLKAGSPLKRRDLFIPKLIKRGAIVTLTFHRGGISLSAEGEALVDGQRGDIVRVKNLKSKKIVTGRVIGVNQVDVAR